MASFILFNVFILFLVTIDYMIVSKNSSMALSIKLSIVWILLGLAFAGYIYAALGYESSMEYLSAYFIEKTLSADNLFVFFLVFSKFGIESRFQHKVLFIGIWTALILRCVMIFAIGSLIESFHFIIPLFGLFLLYAGVTSFSEDDKDSSSKIEKFVLKLFPNVEKNHQGDLFVRKNGRLLPTLLIPVLGVIELSDIVFAFDSIPAIFSVTSNKMIVYTANAFAIIGLRSLYGVFTHMIQSFRYLKHGVGVILCFIGCKMICADLISINATTSLMIIVAILSISFVISLEKREKTS